MYNRIILVGNLTRDIELRFVNNNLAVAKTGIAVNRKSKSGDEVMFVDITSFGRTAEVMNQYLRKGSKILVEGRLVLEQWVDQNGQKRSKHSVTVDNMQMLSSQGDVPQQGGYQQNNNNYNAGYNNYNQPSQQPQQNFGNYGGSSYNQQPQTQNTNNYQQNNSNFSQPDEQKSAVNPKLDESNNNSKSGSTNIPEIDIDDDQVPF
jgi:single-strand DNA-binding protein